MIDTPRITRTEPESTAVIHLTIPRSEIRTAMGPGIKELMATVSAQGITPAGPWFTHHLRMDPATFDVEIGVPVSSPVAHSGRVSPGQLPAATVARTVFHGGYEGLSAAWREFDAWITAQGRTPVGDLVERYLVGPESGPDPSSWRTELTRPLAD